MRNPRSISALYCLCVFGLLAGACQQQAAEPVRLVAMHRPHFTDLPLPRGFVIVEEESEDRMTGKRRVYVRHVYTGDANPINVRSFYTEQMPLHKWVRVHAGSVRGAHTMRYEKGSESCTITITRDGSWTKKTRVEAMILQEEQGDRKFEPEITS